MPKPFDTNALTALAVPELRPSLGVGAIAWRFMLLVPLEEVNQHGQTTYLASDADIEAISEMLCNHFAGVTVLPPLKGWGLRDPQLADTIELNKNVPFVVYARPASPAERYFEKLQGELEQSFDQGVILVERQEVYLMAGRKEFLGGST